MSVSHEAMRDEIGRLQSFLHSRGDDARHDDLIYALEDLPEDARKQAEPIMAVPPGSSYAERVIEVTENAAADVYGTLETVTLLHFLSRYKVTRYIYRLDDHLSRGSRLDGAKLAELAGTYTDTINLCAEMPDGDEPQIRKAGASLKTHWIPIKDGTAPRRGQVLDLLWILRQLGSGRAYLHCEAGKGRTGVMAACYRMAVMGWSPEDAVLEAKNFGCPIPGQIEFIEDFGQKLAQHDDELAPYPVRPLGSHILTAEERDATIVTAAE